MAKPKKSAAPAWSEKLHQLLKRQNIRQVGFVPDAGHASLIRLCDADRDMRTVRLTTEEEGVALAVGAWLGGEKSVLLMQSSGVGNCINMLSMLSVCQVPLPMLVTMRGDWAEFNPWQVPMGRGSQGVLEEMGVVVNRADREEDVVPLGGRARGQAKSEGIQ
jgi:sulfopyruvate decarboxylase alpha subunit